MTIVWKAEWQEDEHPRNAQGEFESTDDNESSSANVEPLSTERIQDLASMYIGITRMQPGLTFGPGSTFIHIEHATLEKELNARLSGEHLPLTWETDGKTMTITEEQQAAAIKNADDFMRVINDSARQYGTPGDYDENTSHLQRGVYDEGSKLAAQFVEGATVDLPMSSWSMNPEVAGGYASQTDKRWDKRDGDTSITFHAPGATGGTFDGRAEAGSTASRFWQSQVLTGGRFVVDRVETFDRSTIGESGMSMNVYLRQVDVALKAKKKSTKGLLPKWFPADFKPTKGLIDGFIGNPQVADKTEKQIVWKAEWQEDEHPRNAEGEFESSDSQDGSGASTSTASEQTHDFKSWDDVSQWGADNKIEVDGEALKNIGMTPQAMALVADRVDELDAKFPGIKEELGLITDYPTAGKDTLAAVSHGAGRDTSTLKLTSKVADSFAHPDEYKAARLESALTYSNNGAPRWKNCLGDSPIDTINHELAHVYQNSLVRSGQIKEPSSWNTKTNPYVKAASDAGWLTRTSRTQIGPNISFGAGYGISSYASSDPLECHAEAVSLMQRPDLMDMMSSDQREAFETYVTSLNEYTGITMVKDKGSVGIDDSGDGGENFGMGQEFWQMFYRKVAEAKSKKSLRKEWSEDDHPRDADGEFRSGGDGGESSQPEWKPTMTSAEARNWAKDSAIKETLYHGTPAANADAIRQDGFRPSFVGASGGGIYLTDTQGEAAAFGDQKRTGDAQTLEIRVNVQNPASAEQTKAMLDEVKETGAKRAIAVQQMAQARGFDALTIPIQHFTYSSVNYVVFNPKNVTVVSDADTAAKSEWEEDEHPRNAEGEFEGAESSGATFTGKWNSDAKQRVDAQLARLLNEFPKVRLARVGVTDRESAIHGIANASMGGQIEVSRALANGKYRTAEGMGLRSQSEEGLINHEFGHLVSDALPMDGIVSTITEALGFPTTPGEVKVTGLGDRLEHTTDLRIEAVQSRIYRAIGSSYARQSPEETIAEVFADGMSSNPSKVGTALVEYARSQLGNAAKSMTKDWDESKHPRAANGEFGSGGGIDIERTDLKGTAALDPAQVKSYVQEHGVAMQAIPLPAGVQRGNPNECFKNASIVLIESRTSGSQEYKYCEGIVERKDEPGVSMLHGWLVNKQGQAVDPTLDDPTKWNYHGVVYSWKEYATFCRSTGCAGVLGGDQKSAQQVLDQGGIS